MDGYKYPFARMVLLGVFMEKTIFEICENNIVFDDIREKINSGKFDNIDWYNLESVMYETLSDNFDSEQDFPYIEYLLEERFAKIKRGAFQPSDINYVSLVILNEIISNDRELIYRGKLKDKDYCISKNIKNSFDKALRDFETYNVLEKCVDNRNTLYGLDLKSWFKQSKYHIYDYSILQQIAPLVIAYVKNGNIKTYNIEQLFKRVSEIIEFAIRPSVLHNPKADIEEQILITIEENESNSDTSDYEKKGISAIHKSELKEDELIFIPLRIKIESNGKFVVCVDIESNLSKEIPLDELFIKNVVDISYEDVSLTKNFVSDIDSLPIIEDKEVEVILECDTIAYEYFKMKPLKNMKKFETIKSMETFTSVYKDVQSKENKFYIVAKDNEEMVLSTVLHTLPYAKIIKPISLNDKLFSKFKKYADDIDIDICKNDDNPVHKSSEEKENIDNSEVKKKNLTKNTNRILNSDFKK